MRFKFAFQPAEIADLAVRIIIIVQAAAVMFSGRRLALFTVFESDPSALSFGFRRSARLAGTAVLT